jgi:hypothetical protein
MDENINLVLRNTIIDLLDSEDGVNDKGFEGIIELCEHYGWQDIISRVESESSGHFLWGGDAEILRMQKR